MSTVKTDDTVKVHYTGKFDDGQVFDSSVDREPLEFKVGEGKVIPGFEKAVVGMKLNESKTIDIPKEEGYGDVNEELVQEVKKELLPKDMDVKEGMDLVSKHPDGNELIVRVKEVKEDVVIVDANHPLAGKNLVFDITVTAIN